MDLQSRFNAALEALRPGPKLVVGVSGGMDSMALLDLLQSSGKKLAVAHFNHQLRDAESDGDEAFVREQAEKRGLEFHAARGDVRAEAKGISIEMAARKLRHAFLAHVASDAGGDITLAHHADDQIELVLMRARRGVEGYGAGGMREQSPSPANPAIRVLRPLLHFRKAELQAFVEERQVPFREDSSNAQLDAERNRMRHKTLPMLRDQFGPNFESELLRHVQTIHVNDDWWRQAAKAWSQGDFRSLPERLQKEIVVVQLEQLNISAGGKVLDAILASVAKPVAVSPSLVVVMDANGRLTVREESTVPKPLWIDLHLGENCAEFSGSRLTWSINNVEATNIRAVDMMVFDADLVGQFVKLRLPEEGDRVRLSGRGSERPLLDVLARNKIPQERRKSVVVAETEHGDIFWVEGLRITEKFKVTDITSFVLEWRWKRP